ncbi:MAG TPA: SDR family NAD(P)-dependent oxidoreductase [Rariglobus sp.]|nr:SDR family NAD(P)-dependent oxidoreductase [Rariglobus sp.]
MSSLSEELVRYAAVVVTGGSSGIGKSFIGVISRLHPGVVICNLSRSVPDINISKLRLGHVPCDLSDRGAISGAADEVLRFLKEAVPEGPVLMINNSGFGSYGRFAEAGLDEQLGMIDVNVRAVVELTHRLLPMLKERGGAIITVASTAAFQPTPYLATYGATKAFVLHWSLALNEELRGTGVRAMALCPGPTSTEFFKRAGLKEGAVSDSLGQTCEEVVDAALHALIRERPLVVSGWKNKVMSAVSSKLPKPFIARLSAKILGQYRLKQVAR